MLKYIKIALFILLFTLPLMFFGIHKNTQYAKSMSRGNYFFENTRNNPDVHQIVIEFEGNNAITFVEKNNIWRVKEADDYYASYSRISVLIDLLRDATIYRADWVKKQQNTMSQKGAVSIKTFDSNLKQIDYAIILPKEERNQFHYAFLNNDNYLYQVTGIFDLSPFIMDWVQMPFFDVPNEQIKRITTNNFDVYRRFSAEEMKTVGEDKEVVQIRALTSNLWYLSAIDIKHAIHFDTKKYKKIKSYEITTLDGIVYTMDIFSDENEYWFNIRLDTELMSTSIASRLLEENRILYDGWFFEVEQQLAESISNFTL